MKILYLHQYFTTYSGSNGTRSFIFAKKLLEKGHQVHMVCINDERSKTGLTDKFIKGKRVGYFEGIKITEFNIKYSNHKNFLERVKVFILFSIKSTILSLKDDSEIIFASSTPLTVSFAGIINKFIKGKIFIFEIRDSWPKLPIKMGIIKNRIIINLLNFYERVSILSADKCIGLAPGICKDIKDINKNPYLTELIPNFCNINIPNKNVKKDLIKKHRISLDKNDFIAVFTGAHGIANGLDQILEAAKELIKLNRSDIKFLFIGDGIKKKSIIERVKKENISNCYFIPFLKKSDLALILNNVADVGLMNLENIKEFGEGTSPNKFFDYLALGLPIICNYPGWISRLIIKYKCGLITKPNDPKNYAKALMKLADNKKLLKEMKENSVKISITKYSSSNISKKLVNLVEKTYEMYSYRTRRYFFRQIYLFTKDITDRGIALISLFMLSPLLLFIGILIKINMGGKIFFLQKRPGKFGKIFTIVKFRTMKNKDKELLEDHLRITKLGSFLRKSSLDELPELINIIMGDMSFIGPRPLLIEYLNLYTEEQHIRHNLKPGITGLAQINGRNSISWEDKFKYDVSYVKNVNIILDLKILFITCIKVFKKSDINFSNTETMPKLKKRNKMLQ